MFEGGEFVDNQNSGDIDAWTPEGIQQAFIDYFSEGWAEEVTDMYTGGDMKMKDTINIVNDSMAQATTDAYDGGMTYMVRID